MNSSKAVAAILLLLASLAAVGANTPKNMGVGQTRNITFVGPVKVGGAVLPAGNYRVEHVMEGENHVMVFENLGKKEAAARVNCQMIELQNKAAESSQEYETQDGAKVLKALTFRGDTYKHQF